MTTSALSTPDAPQGMSYARARLWLGISGVGTAVLAATALLAFDVPARALPAAPAPLAEHLLDLLPYFGAVLLLFLPFDVLGGAIVVRTRPSLAAFAARWLRGVTVQLLVWFATAAVLMVVARRGAGTAPVIAAFVGVQVALAFARTTLARVIAGFAPQPAPERLQRLAREAGLDPARLTLWRTPDEGFVGGWSGLGARRLVLPERWLELPDDALLAVLRRRRRIAASGAHRRGVLGAIAWNTAGFAAVLALSAADVATAAGLATVAAGMTLWAFLGVLVLPTPSRAAVYALDAATPRPGATQASDAAALSAAIERLDRWQDDEARRSPGVETVFHPVPARSARLARLALLAEGAAGAEAAAARRAATAAHHVARHALWLGWGTFSPLARAVHCNVGRPALWAMLPGD
jgi:hypothetical protein